MINVENYLKESLKEALSYLLLLKRDSKFITNIFRLLLKK